jgi:hypothetical protein
MFLQGSVEESLLQVQEGKQFLSKGLQMSKQELRSYQVEELKKMFRLPSVKISTLAKDPWTPAESDDTRLSFRKRSHHEAFPKAEESGEDSSDGEEKENSSEEEKENSSDQEEEESSSD